MVPTGLRRLRRGYATGAAALTLALTAACPGGEPARRDGAAAGPDSASADAAERVRARYTARDLVAAGAWTWRAGNGSTFVLVDVQSTVPGLVQSRVDLWLVADTLILPVGRSDVMPAAAEIAAYEFSDLTGDGLPDLLGHVADSAGSRYAIFLPGARGAMGDELEAAAPGWRFGAEGDSLPSVLRGGSGRSCALRLWAEEPAPDGGAEGWRFLLLLRENRLGAPTSARPACP